MLCCENAVLLVWVGKGTEPLRQGSENIMFRLKIPVFVAKNKAIFF